MKVLAIALSLLALTTPSIADANFIMDYKGWKNLTYGFKVGYVSGITDSYLQFYGMDSKADRVAKTGFMACLINLEISPDQMVATIEAYYVANVDKWNEPPANIYFRLYKGTQGACKDYMYP